MLKRERERLNRANEMLRNYKDDNAWLVDALTGLNRRREMGFVGTAPRGLLYLFGERYAWARPPCLFSAGPDPSRSF